MVIAIGMSNLLKANNFFFTGYEGFERGVWPKGLPTWIKNDRNCLKFNIIFGFQPPSSRKPFGIPKYFPFNYLYMAKEDNRK